MERASRSRECVSRKPIAPACSIRNDSLPLGLQQRLLEAQETLKRAGITIDLQAEDVAALPAPETSGMPAPEN
jgi:hypothetical protein